MFKIKYLEIGSFYGANIISVAENYGSHYESELFCIDPYVDYNEYSEYKGNPTKISNTFEDFLIRKFQNSMMIFSI